MRADIHDGPEHHTLQSKAGYIDARPHRQLGKIHLQRTAGPYIGVKTGSRGLAAGRLLYPGERTSSGCLGTAPLIVCSIDGAVLLFAQKLD